MRLVVVGGSDAGVSAALRAVETDPTAGVTVVVADAFPNYSICGIPYYIAGDVGDWRDLAHRTRGEIEEAGVRLRLDTEVTRIDAAEHRIHVREPGGAVSTLGYDALVVGTGAVPVRPPIAGLDALGPADGVHVLHTMGDVFALDATFDRWRPRSALIVGAGYVGLEMAEALVRRGIEVTQVEMLPEVLPTVDPELGALVRAELERNGVAVRTGTAVTAIRTADRESGRLHVDGAGPGREPVGWDVDLVLVVVGVRPDGGLLLAAGAEAGPRGAVLVGPDMTTGLPEVWAAGDCVTTLHRLLGVTYLPLGTTAHKQGRVAGANAVGGSALFGGIVGTQVVKVFDLVAARTGLRDGEATAAGYAPATTQLAADDHKAYYPGASRIAIRVTGDQETGLLLGAQLVGALGAQVAKRVDVYAAALHHGMAVDAVSELDLAYTPPLGSPWDAVQLAAQHWTRTHGPVDRRAADPGVGGPSPMP